MPSPAPPAGSDLTQAVGTVRAGEIKAGLNGTGYLLGVADGLLIGTGSDPHISALIGGAAVLSLAAANLFS